MSQNNECHSPECERLSVVTMQPSGPRLCKPCKWAFDIGFLTSREAPVFDEIVSSQADEPEDPST